MQKRRGDRASLLDLFLLRVLAEDGPSTPYVFQQKLKISPGASIPALRSLQKRGLISKDKAGPHRRQAFSLTAAGRKHLQMNEVAEYVENVPLDSESFCRLIALAGGRAEVMAALFDSAIARTTMKLRSAKVLVAESRSDLKAYSASTTYYWAWTRFEEEKWKAQLKALRQIRSLLLQSR
jgi:DNA-binding PadR family transcriptional regulator